MNEEITFMWTLPTAGLITVALAAIALLLTLIILLRIHAFIALVLVSLATALAAGIAPANVVKVLLTGFGGTLGSVALLVGLGAILGRLLEASGGAERLTNSLIRAFGEKRAPLAVAVASLLMGFPIFFDAGFVLMLPIIYSVARRLEVPFLMVGFPSVAAFLAMHAFVPPHPGPVSAAEYFGADQGLTTLLGLVIVMVVWAVAGLVLTKPLVRNINVGVPDLLGQRVEDRDDDEFNSNPHPAIVVFLLLFPLTLIAANTILTTLNTAGIVSQDLLVAQLVVMVGQTPVALLITVLIAIVILGESRGKRRTLTESITDSALGPVCSVILITGAGGMFGGVLRSAGIGDAIAGSMEAWNLPVIVTCFAVAILVRIAQGSATVALTTAASLMQSAVVAADYNQVQLVATVMATAAGSTAISHVNDSGFWLVSRFFGMTTAQTLRSWTVMSTVAGFTGFLLALGLFALGSAF